MIRALLAPETLQISTMDCGVAALSTMLVGYGVPSRYEQLRERCQTGADGTSIDLLEQVAQEEGIDATQQLVPADLLADVLRQRLPAIVVTTEPAQPPHFVVIWRLVGGFAHIMDPAHGRRWIRLEELRAKLLRHRHYVPADEWHLWWGDSSFRDALRPRVQRLLPAARAASVLAELDEPTSLQDLAHLDTALRITHHLASARSGARPSWNLRVFEATLARLKAGAEAPDAMVSLRPQPDGRLEVVASLVLATHDAGWRPIPRWLVRLRPKLAEGAPPPPPAAPPDAVWLPVLRILGARSGWVVAQTLLGVTALTVASTLEIVAYRASYEAPHTFATKIDRLGALSVVALLVLVVAGLELVLSRLQYALGRALELRLRVMTYELLPEVDDTFIGSRPTSDLAYRAHGLALARQFPLLVYNGARSGLALLATGAALVWIDRGFAPTLLAALLAFALMASFARRRGREVDFKLQVHGARLLTLFLDALRGFRPVRLHGYQPAFRLEQSRELESWHRTGELQARTRAALSALDGALSATVVVSLLLLYVFRTADIRTFALVAFWTLRIPQLTTGTIQAVQSYPTARAAFTRALEITRYHRPVPPVPKSVAAPSTRGVSLQLDDVEVVRNASTLLTSIRLTIPSGQHVAVVGPSGAGKSSLAGVVLGFLTPNRGRVTVDGVALTEATVQQLRAHTAWVDPAVQLWNSTFADNLEYAARGATRRPLLETLDASDLLGVLESLDQGLETELGSDGRLISGGEGQRLRLGRALLRADARLVVLDEPFRGLEREVRLSLARRAQEAWRGATMLFVSHDIEHALEFERVLVVENGRIVEDGDPRSLAVTATRFADLLRAERRLLDDVWSPRAWDRLRVAGGTVRKVES